MCASACCLSAIIHFVPFRKLSKSIPDPNLRSKSIVTFQPCAVRIGDRHIAGLHAYELPVAFEIIVLRQDTCTNEFFLQGRNVVQQVFGSAAADVVDSVGRQRETIFSGLLLRGSLHNTDDTLDDVVNVGEVTLAVAVVEDLDGLPSLQLLRGGEVEHVRAACRTVNSEEAETGGRNIVELAVAVRQELVGLFSGRVEGDRVIDLVFYCEGHFFVAAVYGGAGGVDQVLDAFVSSCAVTVFVVLVCACIVIGVAAGFQNIVETDQVALDVDVRMIDRVADAGLRSQIDYDGWLVYCKHFVDKGLVGNTSFNKDVPDGRVNRIDHAKAVLLELRVVVIVHVVETDHGTACEFAAQAHNQICSDEAGGAGDQDGFAVQIDGSLAHCISSWV